MEQLLKSLPPGDTDSDGIPDALSRILNDGDFGLDSSKWQNRRKAVFYTLTITGGLQALMIILWCYKLLVSKDDMPANMLQFGMAVFYANSALFTAVLMGYLGFSQADSNAYRKHSVDLAKSLPPPTTSNTSAYGGYPPGYGYPTNAYPPGSPVDLSAPPAPPTPVGPSTPKSDIIL